MIGNNESFNVSGLELNSPWVQYIRGRNPDIPQKFSRSSRLASALAPEYTNLAPLSSFVSSDVRSISVSAHLFRSQQIRINMAAKRSGFDY
jgi:hypothetical protein